MKFTKHEDLDVYQLAFNAAMLIFEVSLNFPKEERYALTDQIRRSSRSVCANLAEAFYKRRYPNYFISNLGLLSLKGVKPVCGLNFLLNATTCRQKYMRILTGIIAE